MERNLLLDTDIGSDAVVYRAPVAIHRSIGFDVTKHMTMQAAEVRERLQYCFFEHYFGVNGGFNE